MKQMLEDAVKRFNRLYEEREVVGDVGYVSITEELASVAVEIATLTAKMIQPIS